MYMSRVEIDTADRRKIRDLTHLGAFHSWVENSFPAEIKSGTRSRKLWRIDKLGGKKYLLIVSHERPDIDCLEKYGIHGSGECKNYDPFLQKINNGDKYCFRAVLNPVHSVSTGEGNRGRVFPEVTEEKQMQYFLKKASINGFNIGEGQCNITERSFEILRKTGERPVRLCKVAYEGILIVADTDIFRKALTEGIGRKKAYGFGMMTIIPEGR